MGGKIFITGGGGKTGNALLEIMFEHGERGRKRTAAQTADDRFGLPAGQKVAETRGAGALGFPPERGTDVTCLCRSDACRDRLTRFPVHIVEGDASDAGSLGRAYRGEETVIHLSSIFHAPAVIEACREAKRLIMISSTGVFSRYRRTADEMARCEALVESSGIPYTILRPTMIYGTPDDRNVSRLVRFIERRRIVPLPGGGRSRFQPVHVTDLARCISYCLSNEASIGKSYNVPGGSAHSLREIVEIIAEGLGRKVTTVPIPLSLAITGVRALSLLSGRRGIDTEQIERLREDKTFAHEGARTDLGYVPMSFREGIRLQLEAMGLTVEQIQQ